MEALITRLNQKKGDTFVQIYHNVNESQHSTAIITEYIAGYSYCNRIK